MARPKKVKVTFPETPTPTSPSIGSSFDDSEDVGYDPALDPENIEEPISVEEIGKIDIEFKGFDDTLEKRYLNWDGAKWEVIIFPKALLQQKFCDSRGMLALPKVVKSEWFSKVLKRYNFTSDWRFKKDDQGRILLPMPEEHAYGVWQRI